MKGQKDRATKKYVLAVDDDHDIVKLIEQALLHLEVLFGKSNNDQPRRQLGVLFCFCYLFEDGCSVVVGLISDGIVAVAAVLEAVILLLFRHSRRKEKRKMLSLKHCDAPLL